MLALLGGSSLAQAWQVTPGDREFNVSTATLSVTVRDAQFVEIRDRQTGELWADRTVSDLGAPTGLGLLSDLDAFRKIHIPWGEPSLGQHLALDFPLSCYFRPGPQTKYELTHDKDSLAVKWRGLTNGQTFYPKAELTLNLSENSDGSISYQLIGVNPDGNVFGATTPLVNLTREAKIIVPSFGGMEYAKDGLPGLIPLGGAPFMDAPLVIAQRAGRSLAIWSEDATMRPFYAFFRRSGRSFSLGLETLALMPFETQKSVVSPTFKLQAFDGDWKAAASPYRNWYRETFKADLAVRDDVPWVRNIKAIVDIYMTIPPDDALARIASLFPKDSVMFQVWNARAPDFDTNLPDWTPRAGYVEGVKRAHANGFKVMAYVNTYCANYLSPVWKRDRLSDFVLIRKNGYWTYKGKSVASLDSPMNEKLIGTVDYSDGPDQFAGLPEGRLIYTDPLSIKWRRYHADMMKTWNEETGTDANYEDTAGCVADGGNGVVDGLSAGEGSVAIMRELQKKQPGVAMSSEYGPAGIAFATSWALNYAGHWGNDEFKRYRIGHQHPVSTFLFGYRQWISAMMGTDGLRCHAMEATSDSTGGLGFSMVDFFLRKDEAAINSNFDWPGHLYRRARLFAEEGLEPAFPEGNYPPNVRCYYRGNSGIFTYVDDGVLQQMLDSRGEPVYGRAFHATRLTTKLWLNNWPLQNGSEIFGLDPRVHYPLFVKPSNARNCALSIDGLPDRVFLKKYYDAPNYAFLALDSLPGGPREITLNFKSKETYAQYYANDVSVRPGSITAKLPLRLVAVTPAADQSLQVPLSSAPPDVELRSVRGQTLFLQNGKNSHSDYAVHVPAEDTALVFYLQSLQDKYPFHGFDGSIVRIFINGQEVKSFDCLVSTKVKPDTFLRRWQIPLAAYAGQDILVSIVTDSKENPIQDRQFVSVPSLIPSAEREIKEKVYDGSFKVIENVAAPAEWDGGLVAELSDGLLLEGSGSRFSVGSIKIDPARTYRLSGKFKARVPWTDGNLLFGLAPLDASSQPISGSQVNPVKGTDTTIIEEAPAGSKSLRVAETGKWKKNPYVFVAFHTSPDLSDLPNRNLIGIEKIEDGLITLRSPLPVACPAGTSIREHESGNSYMYTGAAYQKVPADSWTEFSGEISGESMSGLAANQWWRGTRRARILLIASQPDIMFKDIQLDEIE